MADIGSRLPIPIDQTDRDTKEMKRLWLDSEIKQLESQIASKQRELLQLQAKLVKYKDGYNLIDKVIEAEEIK